MSSDELEVVESSLEDLSTAGSRARQAIVDRINNLDVSQFDETPWTKPNTIRPLPKQEEFMMSKAQVTFYGG
jgi:hypothetical protein